MGLLSENLHQKITDRAISLERVSQGMRRKVLTELRRLERSLVADLNKHSPTGVARTAFQQARLDALLKQTRDTISKWTTGTRQMVNQDLRLLARKENAYLINEMNAQVGVDIATVAMSPEHLTNIVRDTLIEGAPSKDWWGRQSRNLQDRFSRQVREGMLRGETTPQIARRIRGTKAAGYTDGIMNVTRREADALVRTSVQTVANKTRMDTYQQNQDVVKGLQWVSTLDLRTTEICMALHGKEWHYDKDGKTLLPVGHDKEFPGPTAHWGCRSTQIPVVKSWDELSGDGSLRTGGRRTNLQSAFDRNMKDLGMTAEQRGLARFNARASMDGYAAREISFDKWLNSKTVAEQNKMLGPGRADLFRSGKISVNDLISQRGRPLTLAELTTSPGTAQQDIIKNLAVLPPPTPPDIPLSAPGDKTWFIDSLYEQGGLTQQQILDMTVKQFPDADPAKTLSTIKARPSHMRKAGKIPSWIKTKDPIKLPPKGGWPDTPPAPVGPPAPVSGMTKTAYIDSLYNGQWTRQEMLDSVLKHFPGSDARKTYSTILARPSHMKKAGLSPSWKASDQKIVFPDTPPAPPPAPEPPPPAIEPAPAGSPPIADPRPPTINPGEAPTLREVNLITKDVWKKRLGEWYPVWEREIPDVVKKKMDYISQIEKVKKKKTAYYSSGRKSIHMSTYKPGTSFRSDGVLVHETGHHFHHETGLVRSGWSFSSGTTGTYNDAWKAIRRNMDEVWNGPKGDEIRAILGKNGKKNVTWVDTSKMERLAVKAGTDAANVRDYYSAARDLMGDFLDVIEALSNGDYGCGHGRKYYRQGNYYTHAEIAAHLFRTNIQTNPFIQHYFPDAVAMMRKWMGLA